MKPVLLTMQAFGPYAKKEAVDFRDLKESRFFLIHGPTGSGKTTLLDAICFALYGECSGDDRKGTMARCQKADPETLTEVTFEFCLRDRRYRVRRTPKYDRPKLRGEGTTTQQALAQLEDVTALQPGDSADGRLMEGQIGTVNEAVEKLLGFKADQFRQVMILPQGEFRKLLVSSGTDRQEILEKLFRTSLYTKIQDALDARRKGLEAARDEKVNEIKGILRGDTPEALEERIAEQRRSVLGKKQQVPAAESADRQAALVLQKGEHLAQRFEEHEAAVAKVQGLEAKQDRMKGAAERLRMAKAALPLQPLEREATVREREKLDAVKAREDAVKALQKKEQAAEKAATALQAEVERQGERDAAGRAVVQLEELRESVESLESARAAAEASTKKAAEAEGTFTAAVTAEFQNQAALEAAEKESAEQRPLAMRQQALEAEKKESDRLLILVEVLAKDENAYKNAKEKVRAAQKELEAATLQRDVQRSAVAAMRHAQASARAVVLARDLKEGDPCPVCGSEHHPAPAFADVEPPSDEQIAEAEETLHAREAAREKASIELGKLQTKAAAAEAQVAGKREQLAAAGAPDPQVLRAQAARLLTELKNAQRAAARLMILEKELKELKAKSEALRGAVEARRQERDAAKATAAERTKELELLEKRVPEELRTRQAFVGALQKARTQKEALERALEAARKKDGEATQALEGTRQRAESCAEAQAVAEEKARTAERAFAEALQKSAFAGDRFGYEQARQEKDKIDEMQDVLDRFREDLHAAREAAKAAAEKVKDQQRPDLAALREAAESARRALQKLNDALVAEQTALINDEKTMASLGAAMKEERALAERAQTAAQLATVAKGREGADGRRLAFKEYVLTSLLDEVLISATARLRTLSRGRYALRRVVDPYTNRRSQALELEVDDSWTGQARPVQTLSGGEGFLASLSLALGLADVVQGYAGGIELGMLFIDEGFGTLDQQSLDEAIKILLELQQGEKLVGIISHVRELREVIDVRLEVTPGDGKRAPSVRFHLP